MEARRSGSRPLSRLATWLRPHWHLVPTFIASVTFFYWIVTGADWRPFDMEPLGFYYDALGDSLLHGRLDVTRAAIGMEAFVRDGKHYGYFGATPALFRIPLNLLFPGCWGQWSRLSMTAGFIVTLVFVYRLRRAVVSSSPPTTRANSSFGKLLDNLFLLMAGCGTSLTFLASHSFVYHEAIIWGAAFALASGFWQFRYVLRPDARSLTWAGLTAFLALHARPPTGLGATAGVCMIALLAAARAVSRSRQSTPAGHARICMRHALLAFAWVVLTIGTFLGQSYAKFRTFNAMPGRYYAQYQQDPQRLQRTHGSVVRVGNVPTDALAYFGRPGVIANGDFPWLHLVPHARVLPGGVIDTNEWGSSIPGSMPALILLACVGVARMTLGKDPAARAMRLPAVSLAIGWVPTLAAFWLSERYLHDFYPALVVCAAIGMEAIPRIPNRATRGLAVAITMLLCAYGIAANTAFALEYEGALSPMTSPDKRKQFDEWRRAVDRWVHGSRTYGLPTSGAVLADRGRNHVDHVSREHASQPKSLAG